MITCLPALAGHWRSHAGGALLSTSGMFNKDLAALQRPDLLARADGTMRHPRTINMSTVGRDLLEADPPIEALIVYNSNPVAVAPESKRVAEGFLREDLFTVVLEHFQTDTADYADYVLPATTQLEHLDVHAAYGHFYALANNPAIEPLGEALPNTEIFRRLAARMGFDEPCFRDSDEAIAAAAFRPEGTTTAAAATTAGAFLTLVVAGIPALTQLALVTAGAGGSWNPAQRPWGVIWVWLWPISIKTGFRT